MKSNPRRQFILLLLVVICSSCAIQRQPVIPAEEEVTTHTGQRARVVEVVPDRARWGRAVVWSRGAYRRSENGQADTIVHVGLEVENNSGQSLRVAMPEARVDVNPQATGAAENLIPEAASDTVLEPGVRGEYQLVFVIPPELTPGDVELFEVRLPVYAGAERALIRALFTEKPIQRDPAFGDLWYAPYPFWWRYGYAGPYRHPYYW